jgi:threonyl-tRNA synthetase
MISIQLPDGSKREFPGPVTVAEVAASIGAGLAKAALGGASRSGEVRSPGGHQLPHRGRRSPWPSSPTKDADGLDVIRHSTAHLLAYAVKELFPDAQVTIGPTIEDGFYYDFAYKRPFTPEDLAGHRKEDG